MKILLFKKLAFITIALLLSHPLKASSTEEDREKLLNFSSNGKLRLARLAINHHCSIDQLLDEFENGGDNGDLQLDVDGFLAILGNIGDVGDSLTIRGQKLKDLIDQNVNTATISLGLNNVAGELGGNGDLLTRAQALQGIIEDARIKINDQATSLPGAIAQLEGLVIPVPPSNIYQRTLEIMDELATAQAALATAIGERDTAIGERDIAIGERDTAIGERDTAIGELALAQDIIEDARIEINDTASSLPDAVAQLKALVVPAPPSNNIYLRTQEIIAGQGIAKIIQRIRDTVAGQQRFVGVFPPEPVGGLQTADQVADYVTYNNLNG